jgi:DNA polymerase-1
MRADSIGLFWEDKPSTGKRSAIERPMPAIPETGWKTPTDFPDLSRERVIAIDVETWDPELLEHGPGWARGVGHMVGVSIGVESGHRWYFPMRHETEPEDNMDPAQVIRWLKDTLEDPRQAKVGANLAYDVGWLQHEGVNVKGALVDVQFAEALLDERAKVALDILGVKYLNTGKTSELMYEWLADWFGGNPTEKQRKHIYRTPPRLCGPYAESDVDLPLRLAPILYQKMGEEGLLEVFEMECGLIYLLNAMRYAGVSVDIEKAEKLADSLSAQALVAQDKLNKTIGWEIDIGKKDQLEKAFNQLNIPYTRTKPTASYPEGQPSFTKAFLEGLVHPIGDIIREIRKCEKLKGTFVESYILNSHVNGKVYGQFHNMRGDEGGTRSGRFSSSTPNLQNLPSRDDIWAPMVRGIFIPDYGHEAWRKYDYSQIEYRCLIHDAVGMEGEKVRAMFNADPTIDYHDFIQALIKRETGIFIERKPIKNINFGLIYGMGVPALAAAIGLSLKDGKALVKEYHRGVPFASATMDYYTEIAKNTGVIETIMGRKSRFDLWEPTQWNSDSIALPLQQAITSYGQIRRAYTHKALNRRLQGSAADMMKLAMYRCWKDGIFDVTGVPRLTVHDELDFSDPGGKDEAFREMQHIMETALPLKIPIKADGEIGPDWGHVEAIAV